MKGKKNLEEEVQGKMTKVEEPTEANKEDQKNGSRYWSR